MPKYLLDSDVLIWCLRNKKETIELVEKLSQEGIPYCSAVSIIEVQVGVKAGEEEATNLLLNNLKVCKVDRNVANLTGEYIRKYKTKGIIFDFVDAIIAATCILNDLILVTYNAKHYSIKDLRILNKEYEDWCS
ncbi:MAG: type II toxin-antitoxin system VapC family toxin [Candidatus Edwardsbacteria bacterium]